MSDNNTQTQLTFIPDFTQKHYELFEIDPSLLDGIINGTQTLKIKSYQQGMTRSAALCSNDATYKLKKSETSNTMFVVGMSSGSILKQTSITVDLERSQTNKYQVAQLILQYPLLGAQDEQGNQLDGQSLSRSDILKQCQISEGELDQMLKGDERFEFYIIEITPNNFSFFDPLSLYQLIDSLLIFINQQQDLSEINAEFVLFNHDGIINDKYTYDSKIIEYALNYIGDIIEGTDQYKLNKLKIIKSIALAMLYVKGDYYLSEFVTALKHALDLALPQNLSITSITQDVQMSDSNTNTNLDNSTSFDSAQNLFEQYTGYDLAFLKGSAIIIPAQELRIAQKHDDVIRLLHPYYSAEFELCNNSAEKRLDALFEIKDKWTQQELVQYLKKFVEIGVNFDNYLIKNAKIIKEKNPFDSSKDIAYYMKKF